jgi:hypothetical protein
MSDLKILRYKIRLVTFGEGVGGDWSGDMTGDLL